MASGTVFAPTAVKGVIPADIAPEQLMELLAAAA